MKQKLLLLTILLLAGITSREQDTILDHYIQIGLESNLALSQKMLSYDKSLESLKEAKGLFFPDISFNARYTVAYGGRTINFPVGDLLNPVYSTLNSLTAGFPPDQQFPDIHVENQDFYFYRPTEQETKLSLRQPIFSPKIHYNYKIKQNQSDAEQVNVMIYKRQLVAEIKKGYYGFLQTWYVKELLKKTRDVVEENVRVNQSLFENNKVTVDVVDRSKAELSKVDQQIAEADKNYSLASAYFNFLLNRPLDSEILRIENPVVEPEKVEMEDLLNNAMQNREEFAMLDAYTQATENSLKLYKMNKSPELFGAVDYGIQGENYAIDDKSDYFLGSLVLKWSLFSGSQNNSRIRQAEIDKKMMEEKREELKKQINLEVIGAYNNLRASGKSIEAARQQQKSAASAFKLVNKKYHQGEASLIEFMDARNTKTNAEENLIITMADYLTKYAELERVAGTYPLK